MFLRLYIRSGLILIHLKYDHPAGWSYLLCLMIQIVGFDIVWPTKGPSLKMDRIGWNVKSGSSSRMDHNSQIGPKEPWGDPVQNTRFLHFSARNRSILEDGPDLAGKPARVSTRRGVGGRVNPTEIPSAARWYLVRPGGN